MTYFQPSIFFFSRDIKKAKKTNVKTNVKTNEIKENDKPLIEIKNNT
jgi:hypothetical protein